MTTCRNSEKGRASQRMGGNPFQTRETKSVATLKNKRRGEIAHVTVSLSMSCMYHRRRTDLCIVTNKNTP